jgi:hypothetical protein
MSDATPRESGLDRRTLLVGGGILVGVGALAPRVMGDGPDDDPPADLFAANFDAEVSAKVAQVVPIGGDGDQVRVESTTTIKSFADGAAVAVVLAGNGGTADVEKLGDAGPVKAAGVVKLVFGEYSDLATARR